MTADLNLTAAIGAAETAMYADACPHDGTEGCNCPDLQREAALAVEAALPHIREALAQQIESISTYEPGDGKRRSASMRAAAARIVRGES